jgi:hypothetical protein
MSVADTPPMQTKRSRRWYIVVSTLVGIVGLTAVFGGVHWYNLYARSLPTAITTPRLLDSNGTAEKKAEKAEKAAGGNAEKAVSDGKSGTKASAKDQAGADQSGATEKVGSHKSTARPTTTPGA